MESEVIVEDRAVWALRKLEGKPYLVKSAVAFLETVINKESAVLEMGSGSSTIWFAERAKQVISFEDKEEWFQIVWSELKERNLTNTVIYFRNDISVLNPDDRFDICLVDGTDRKRISFTQGALSLMKPGGYIAFDNTEHKRLYREAMKAMDDLGWERQDFEGEGYGRTKHWITTIWRKPDA